MLGELRDGGTERPRTGRVVGYVEQKSGMAVGAGDEFETARPLCVADSLLDGSVGDGEAVVGTEFKRRG